MQVWIRPCQELTGRHDDVAQIDRLIIGIGIERSDPFQTVPPRAQDISAGLKQGSLERPVRLT